MLILSEKTGRAVENSGWEIQYDAHMKRLFPDQTASAFILRTNPGAKTAGRSIEGSSIMEGLVRCDILCTAQAPTEEDLNEAKGKFKTASERLALWEKTTTEGWLDIMNLPHDFFDQAGE